MIRLNQSVRSLPLNSTSRRIRGRSSSPVARERAANGGSAASVVDTHRSSWYSGCTDSGLRCDTAASGCRLVSPRNRGGGVRSSGVAPRRRNTRCPVAEDRPRGSDPLSSRRSYPSDPSLHLRSFRGSCAGSADSERTSRNSASTSWG